MLSEHQCEGFLEGFLLTGRHGLFNSYEAFIRIVAVSYTHLDVYKRQVLEGLEIEKLISVFIEKLN